MCVTVCSLHGQGSIPSHGRVFQGILPWSHSAPRPEPVWQKIAQSPLYGTIQPVAIEIERWRPTTDGRWVKKWCTSISLARFLGSVHFTFQATLIRKQSAGTSLDFGTDLDLGSRLIANATKWIVDESEQLMNKQVITTCITRYAEKKASGLWPNMHKKCGSLSNKSSDNAVEFSG